MLKPGDARRLFVQAILSRGILSEDLAKTLWKQCLQAVKDVDDSVEFPEGNSETDNWNLFVSSVNKTLDNLDFEFKLTHDESSGKKIYALVNRKDDEVAQLATDYSPAEIKYFKRIVEEIMLAPNEAFSISSLAALRDTGDVKPKTQAETTLASFVAKGWLLKSKRGRYSLSMRTILELGAYIKSTYDEEHLECLICKDMMTKGIACPNANCKVRMHKHCFALTRRTRTTCPSCHQNWEDESELNPVGEDAARGDESSTRRRATQARRSDDEDSDEESQPAATRRRSQAARKSKGKSKKSTRTPSDEEEEEEDQLQDDDD